MTANFPKADSQSARHQEGNRLELFSAGSKDMLPGVRGGGGTKREDMIEHSKPSCQSLDV